jgi:hypothetical protein
MTHETMHPHLFGLVHTNRDFSVAKSWGKNIFNSAFPAALLCYMGAKQVPPIYLTLGQTGVVQQSQITAKALLGLPHQDDNLFFSFEEAFTPYADLIIGTLPRADLVTRHRGTANKDCLSAFEIKLTTLPDDATAHLPENQYGCEIVIRPDTILYVALSIAQLFTHERNLLQTLLAPADVAIADWTEAVQVRPFMPLLCQTVEVILQAKLAQQTPLLLQPVWKTRGKTGVLADHCYDMFVWSNFSLVRLVLDQAEGNQGSFTRPERTIVWLVKMLADFAQHGKINPKQVVDQLTYNTKNDKALAVSGRITHTYMNSVALTTPRIPKWATREIILGGGQHFLSPERRLDAIILNSPHLFEEPTL